MKKNSKALIDWKNVEDRNNVISILNFININQGRIKKKYIAFINSIDLKKERIEFQYKGSFNIWETSVLKEVSFYKSDYLNDVIKIFALKLLVEESDFDNIIISSLPSRLKPILKTYFNNNNIKCNYNNSIKQKSTLFLFNNNFYHYCKSILFLAYHFYSHFFLIVRKPITTNFKKNKVLLFGYLAHLKTETFNNNEFRSSIWGSLPEILKINEVEFNFMDIYVKTKNIYNSKYAHNLINKLNSTEKRHSLIFSYLEVKDYLKVLVEFVKLQFRFLNVSLILRKKLIYEGINLYYLYENDIKKSFNGVVLLENLIWNCAFKNFFSSVKEDINIIYIQENQSWECILLNNFRLYNKGKIFSLQNSVLRNWDLRYYNRFSNMNFKPDNYLINSKTAYDSFVFYGYPKKKIIELESLRYSKYKNIHFSTKKNKNSVLLLGDYQINDTKDMLNKIIPYLSENGYSIGYKAHPARSTNFNILLKYNIKIEFDEISNLIDYENFIVSTDSASSIDIFLLGIKPIIYTIENKLNNNPLSNQKDLLYSSDKKEILEYLQKPKNKVTNHQDFFYFDDNYFRWNDFIKKI